MLNNIYLDNAATSFPKPRGLTEYVSKYINEDCVNINRGVYDLSNKSFDLVLDTRNKLAKFFHCEEDKSFFEKRIIFTSGVTYSLNVFLRGVLKENDEIIISGLEHHAVTRTLYDLKIKRGIKVIVPSCDKYGRVDNNSIEELLNDKTKAVLINHASNVFGSINDIEAIGNVLKDRDVFYAVDSAQTAGIVDIDVEKSSIDFLAFSGHKGLHALEGVGGFVISKRLSEVLDPLVTGGTGFSSDTYEQPKELPDKYESGTLNLPGIAALNYSISYLNEIGIDNIRNIELMLRKRFINGIRKFEGIKIYCDDIEDENTVGLVSISFLDKDNADIALTLSNEYGIMLREGLHCSLLAHKTMGTEKSGTIRFSFGYNNTEKEVDYAIECIEKVINR